MEFASAGCRKPFFDNLRPAFSRSFFAPDAEADLPPSKKEISGISCLPVLCKMDIFCFIGLAKGVELLDADRKN